uniref:Uncharacterized protein n=1 Tax=Globisporangium ultimum (strain ATCC 200006 / CBS 805.95 / DAOM BR144) TaxID=431595 RepID=K3X864_GLOUD
MALATHADEERPIIFGWKMVHEFVEAIAAAYAQAALGDADPMSDPPFLIPQPLTIQSFKKALLSYARTGLANPLDTMCLPCDVSEYGRCLNKLDRLNGDAWFQCIVAVGGMRAAFPVAIVYVPKPCTETFQQVIDPRPNAFNL